MAWSSTPMPAPRSASRASRRGASTRAPAAPTWAWSTGTGGAGTGWAAGGDGGVAAGEAVLWPAGVLHGARTVYGPMRAIAVELAGPDDRHLRAVLEGVAKRLAPGEAGHVNRGVGRLAERPLSDTERDREGEPD